MDLGAGPLAASLIGAAVAGLAAVLVRHFTASGAPESEASVALQHARREAATIPHLVLLAALWSVVSFITTSQPGYLLLVTGATLFVLHTYPQMSHRPHFRWRENLHVIAAAAVLLWIPLRDAPLFAQGLRGFYYHEPSAYDVPYQGSYLGLLLGLTPGPWEILGSATAAALCVLTALGLTFLLRRGVRASAGLSQYVDALGHGGMAMMLLAPFVFAGPTLQHLPAMLVLLLYSYYMSANMSSIRPALVWIVLVSSWAPLLGLARYLEHYVELSSALGPQYVPWAKMLGDFDPFNWHTDVGNSLVLLLVLTYGLVRTSRSVRERRVLVALGVLMFPALVLTFARSAWLACGVAVPLGAVWVSARRRWWVPAAVGTVLALLPLAHVMKYTDLNRLLDRAESNSIRLATAHQVWTIVREHPILGVPPLERDQQWYDSGQTEYHGVGGMLLGWLQVPAEGGLLGTAALLILVAAMAWKVSRAIKDAPVQGDRLLLQCSALALVTLGVSNLFDNPMIYAGSVQGPILLGLILGRGRHSRSLGHDTAMTDSQHD